MWAAFLLQEQRIKELEAKIAGLAGIPVDEEEEDKTVLAPNNQNRVRESQVKVDSAPQPPYSSQKGSEKRNIRQTHLYL